MVETDKVFLIHPTRRAIYKVICETPGTYFYRMISEVSKYTDKISSATLIYHLNKLREADLIASGKISGKRIFFPKNLRNQQMEEAYLVLKNQNALKIFLMILNNAGVMKNQNEVARELDVHHDTVRYHAKKLEEAGLIEIQKEGKLVAFELGQLGKELLQGSSRVFTQTYIQFLMSKLKDSCHFPEILKQTRDKLSIRIVCKDEEDIILTLDLSGWDIYQIAEDIDEEPEETQK